MEKLHRMPAPTTAKQQDGPPRARPSGRVVRGRALRGVRLASLGAASIALALLATTACSDDEPRTGDTSGDNGEERRHGLTADQAAEPLVVIGDTTITVGEFADRLAEQSPYLRARYNSPERRREYLDNLVRFELLAAEAKRLGYDDLPEVQRAREQVMIQQMMKEVFEDRIRLSDISEEDIRAHYEANRAEFHQPEQVRASHILMTSRVTADRVLRQILQNRDDVNFFRRMAEQHNTDAATRDHLGDLRFFSRPEERGEDEAEVPEAVARAAFAIPEIGGVYGELVESPAGFHIVKLTGRRAALERSLDEARRPIQNRLWRERREQAVADFIATLRRDAEIEENLDLLTEVHIELPAGGPDAPETGATGTTADAAPSPHPGVTPRTGEAAAAAGQPTPGPGGTPSPAPVRPRPASTPTPPADRPAAATP